MSRANNSLAVIRSRLQLESLHQIAKRWAPNQAPMATYSEAAAEFTALFNLLAKDLVTLRELGVQQSSSALKRHYVRASLATHEGVTYAFKQMALATLRDNGTTIPDDELELLTELRIETNNLGKIVLRPVFTNTLDNMKFAFKTLAKSHGVSFALATGGLGWKDMRAAVAIRNRISHPKKAADLALSQDEFRVVESAQKWFLDQSSHLMKLVLEASERRVAEAKAEVEKQQKMLEDLQRQKETIKADAEAKISRIEAMRDEALRIASVRIAELQRPREQILRDSNDPTDRRDGA